MTERNEHTPLDALLGAAPRGVLRHWLSLLVLTLAALGAVVFLIRFVSGEDSPYYSTPVERGNLLPLVSERGKIRGSGEVTVGSKLPGRITWISAKSDAEVEKGELLAIIDAGDVDALIADARAQLTGARSLLQAAEVAAQDTGSRLARYESVWRRSGGRAPSLNEIERARADARQADLAVSTARADVKRAELRVSDAEARKAGSHVKAPVSGTLAVRHVRQGQIIAERQPLFTIAQGTAPLTIEVPLSAQPGPLEAGTPAQIRLDAAPDQVHPATLTLLRVPPAPSTAPRRAVFTLARPGPDIRPGMAATVEIRLPERRNVLLVPDAALEFEPGSRNAQRRERIYVLDGGEPRRVYVTVGGSDGKHTEVFASGLKPGDQAIIGWRDAAAGARQPAR
ncbi:efflux RND transporter periplasmic adaptor subunit [Novosphingobium panipatense]|uniref:efflux RND transporter periplasmic adaptor subunit n=1 Tax=Novosphingobium TaxID=165696 RepID=UPI000CDAD9BB|nr:efflux RND transporter periplasmic adaptor subunit [Novosphingobium sp. HII-3]